MATVDMANFAGDNRHQSVNGAVFKPYLVEVEMDFADAVTAKGSALAAADVIEIIDVPANTLILNAGFTVVEAHAGTSTDTAFDFGITGGNVDNFVDGFDFDGASVGDVAFTDTQTPVVVTSADTIDLLLQAMTGTTTGGKIRAWALLVSIESAKRPGRAALGS